MAQFSTSTHRAVDCHRALQRPAAVLAAPARLCVPLRHASCSVGARRRPDFFQGDSVEHVVEEADASSDGLFNNNFKSALATALQRQGKDSLLQGRERLVDENNISDQEDVLKAAIMASKSTLLRLQTARSELEKAIEAETKQVERLMFALTKARNDAAYYRGLANMVDEGGTSD